MPTVSVFVTIIYFFQPLNGAGQSFLKESAMVGFRVNSVRS